MPDGTVELNYTYNFNGVVDMMGVRFDYPEEKVVGKRWLGDGPYRVWQNRLHGTTYNVWENKYNDPVPGESFTYPEFKGYFANCSWMNIETQEGSSRSPMRRRMHILVFISPVTAGMPCYILSRQRNIDTGCNSPCT